MCGIEDLRRLKEEALSVFVHPVLKSYVVELVQATRKDHEIVNGVSPRGSLALFRAVRAYALIGGRDYVVPEDIKALAVPVLAHRLTAAHSFGGHTSNREILNRLLSFVPLPRQKPGQRKQKP